MKTTQTTQTTNVTPGPWRKSNLNQWIYGVNGEYVTRVEGPDTATEEANARLIASAPELLEALLEAQEMLITEFQHQQLPESSPMGQVCLQIGAAIAKARA